MWGYYGYMSCALGYMSCAIKQIVERGIEEELGPEAFEVFERRGGMRWRAYISHASSSGATSGSS